MIETWLPFFIGVVFGAAMMRKSGGFTDGNPLKDLPRGYSGSVNVHVYPTKSDDGWDDDDLPEFDCNPDPGENWRMN